MLIRSICVFAVGLAGLLCVTSDSPAQPGKEGKGGDAIKKLEAELQQLRAQIQDTENKLAKAQEHGRGRGYEGWSRGGFGGKGWKGFEKKGDFAKKKDDFKKEFAKMDPDMIKTRYEFYKKLYDELPKEKAKDKGALFGNRGPTGRGGFGGGHGSIEARLDRLMRELEELRRELKKK